MAIVLGVTTRSTIQTGLERLDVIALVLSLAFLGEGLRAAGAFRYAAYRVANWANGNTRKLLIGVYTLTALLTSNDIVMLALTPILLELISQTDINDARLLLPRTYPYHQQNNTNTTYHTNYVHHQSHDSPIAHH